MIKQWMRFLLLSATILLASCSSTSTLESYNRAMYETNKVIDDYTLKPITKVYQKITHNAIERRVSNFFGNLSEVGTMVNSLLQGKFRNAAVSSSRFVWNTTLGVGGLFDVAATFGLDADKEDFGQTLRVWGVPAGPYVVLPLLGPSTVTDAFGRVGDRALSPLNRYSDWSDHTVREGLTALDVINTRAKFMQIDDLLDTATTDEYLFVKSTYLQSRATLVRDGEADTALDAEVDDIFDDLEEEKANSNTTEEGGE